MSFFTSGHRRTPNMCGYAHILKNTKGCDFFFWTWWIRIRTFVRTHTCTHIHISYQSLSAGVLITQLHYRKGQKVLRNNVQAPDLFGMTLCFHTLWVGTLPSTPTYRNRSFTFHWLYKERSCFFHSGVMCCVGLRSVYELHILIKWVIWKGRRWSVNFEPDTNLNNLT